MGKDEAAARIDQIAAECVSVRLRMINRVITNIYDDALRPFGLKISQMNILVAAAKMGTVRPTDLGEVLHLDTSTLSRNLDRMKARGWLEVVSDEQDGRSQPIRLTRQGRTLLDKAASAWEPVQARVKKLLGEAVVEHLHEAAKRINRAETE